MHVPANPLIGISTFRKYVLKDQLDYMAYNYIPLCIVYYMFHNGLMVKENYFNMEEPN